MANPDDQAAQDMNTDATVRARIAAFRQAVPDGAITTDLQHADGGSVAVRAIAVMPGGARGSGIAAAVISDGDDWAEVVEQTELRAIDRALDVLSPQRKSMPARPAAARTAAAASADDALVAEYSWTAFWPIARKLQLSNEQIEQALGKPLKSATPREAIDALKSAGMWTTDEA